MSGVATIGFPPLPPPLPREATKLRSPSAFLFKIFLAALVIGFVSQNAGPHWLKAIFRPQPVGTSRTALLLPLALILSVLLHEIGHLLPSVGFGFNVARVTLGPISVIQLHGRWTLQYSHSWFRASVSAIPTDLRAWRARMLIVVAGGPIATLGIFLTAVYLLDVLRPAGSAGYFLSVLGEINLFLFVLGLIPNASDASVRNDARLFITLVRNGFDAEQIRLYHAVTQLQVAGVRPRDYPRQLLAPLAVANGNHDLLLFNALTIFLWALDTENTLLADAWDQYANSLMQHRPLRLGNTVLAESACFDLLHRNASAAAVEKLRAVNFELLSPWLRHRSRAVLQIATSACFDALTNLQIARNHLSPPSPYFQFELATLDLLERQTKIGHPVLGAAATAAA